MHLPQEFYLRATLTVARELVGALVRRGPVTLRITETEAYLPGDSACHATRGLTPRTRVMFGPGGHAYVYICYGMHQMLNFVTEPEGVGAAVLIRSCEIIEGHAIVIRRRGGLQGPVLLTGPGKIGQALALDTSMSGLPLFRRGDLEVLEGETPAGLLVGPRVGIEGAKPRDVKAPWRFAAAGTPWVSQRGVLKPLRS
ncbi:Putative 3-methyladenine DNA glycosylase [Planctomycetaceae bacterium]|nr:Putative 3-methyladenine DNA glycosylase [Planctomycetaceae bacterium]